MDTLKLNITDLEKLKVVNLDMFGNEIYIYDDNYEIVILDGIEQFFYFTPYANIFRGLKNDTVIFPECDVEIDGEKSGYLLKRTDGVSLESVIKKLDFNLIFSAIQKVEKDFESLEMNNVFYSHSLDERTIWTRDNKIKIPYYVESFQDKRTIDSSLLNIPNIRSFYDYLESLLFPSKVDSILNYLSTNKAFNQLYLEYLKEDCSISIVDLLNKAIEIFRDEFGIVPKNLKEMEEVLEEKRLLNIDDVQRSFSTDQIPEIINHIINTIPKKLTDIEKARYVYIQLGKFFTYDYNYISDSSEQEKVRIFRKNITDITDNKAVCSLVSKTYAYILNCLGINANVILNGSDDRLGQHADVEFYIGENKYIADLTNDLMNIQTGFKTNYFCNKKESSEKYSNIEEEELKKIDDKIGYTCKRNVYG